MITQNLNKGNSCVPVTPMAIGAQPENAKILFFVVVGQKVLFIIAHMLSSFKAYVNLSPVSCKGKVNKNTIDTDLPTISNCLASAQERKCNLRKKK